MDQMRLGGLIEVLKRKNPEGTVSYGFVYFHPKGIHSYRGYYEQLALGYESGYPHPTVKEVLSWLEDAAGKTFTGYKGGEYCMYSDTRVWVAQHNESGGTAIVDVRDDGDDIILVTRKID